MSYNVRVDMLNLADKCGWYAARQHMVKRGFGAKLIAEVLVALLVWQGAAN